MIKPTGFFGKLPAHGDFIYRDLPASFINALDNWLQGFVGSSREQIGEDWLDTYLTSPIWRFALSEGVVDQHAWAGIMLPSVDRVGRYFPFAIAKPAPSNANPLQLIGQSQWYEAVENAALQALEGRLQLEQLMEEINLPSLNTDRLYPLGAPPLGQKGAVIGIDLEARSLSSAFPYLLDSAIKESAPSYSVWATQGSNEVEPCFFYCSALPRMQGIAALLDGRWSHWGWPEPYRLNNPQYAGEPVKDGNSG